MSDELSANGGTSGATRHGSSAAVAGCQDVDLNAGHSTGPWTAYRAQPDGQNWVEL